ncbi:hypothetical protein, partial [Erwinia amylovora]|uniref:hypothetical protein n=1 Tax=Erwinia amylovora TaxID=552 RepID=UPI00196B84B4
NRKRDCRDSGCFFFGVYINYGDMVVKKVNKLFLVVLLKTHCWCDAGPGRFLFIKAWWALTDVFFFFCGGERFLAAF